jgi:hypothetical protein
MKNKGGIVGTKTAGSTAFSYASKVAEFDTESYPLRYEACVDIAEVRTDTDFPLTAFEVIYGYPNRSTTANNLPDTEHYAPVIGSIVSPGDFVCENAFTEVTNKSGISSALIMSDATRVTGFQFFFKDAPTTALTIRFDNAKWTKSELVTFSDTESFIGFEGSYTDNGIETMGFLVQDPACSIVPVNPVTPVTPVTPVVKTCVELGTCKEPVTDGGLNTSGSGGDDLDTWMIVLIVCAGVTGILAVIGIVFYGCKSKRTQSDKVNVVNINKDAAEERQESQVELSKNVDHQHTIAG